MKAVTGTVTSSKPISLSKASTALSRFAAGDNGARREISAYLKRVSNAFQDLVQVHRELRFIRKGAGVEIKREVEDEDESSRRRKKEEQQDPNPRVSFQANAKVKEEVVDEKVEDEAEERRKKKNNKEKRREKEVVENGEGKKRKHLSVEEAKKSMEKRRRKSVRGCIVSPDLSVRNLVPKAPKIQRLVTPLTLQRKRARIAEKKRVAKAKSEAAEYQKLLASRLKEQRDRRNESLAKKRSRLSAAAAKTASVST